MSELMNEVVKAGMEGMGERERHGRAQRVLVYLYNVFQVYVPNFPNDTSIGVANN